MTHEDKLKEICSNLLKSWTIFRNQCPDNPATTYHLEILIHLRAISDAYFILENNSCLSAIDNILDNSHKLLTEISLLNDKVMN